MYNFCYNIFHFIIPNTTPKDCILIPKMNFFMLAHNFLRIYKYIPNIQFEHILLTHNCKICELCFTNFLGFTVKIRVNDPWNSMSEAATFCKFKPMFQRSCEESPEDGLLQVAYNLIEYKDTIFFFFQFLKPSYILKTKILATRLLC